MSEESLWKGCTSQWVNFWTYVLWLLAAAGIIVAGVLLMNPLIYAALAVPFIAMLIRYLVTRTTVYELTTQRLRRTSGIFHKKLDELELYRVKDSTLEQPFLMRLLGLGHVRVMSSDATMPMVDITAVPGAYDMREKLRVAVEAERDRKRVREVDYAGDEGGANDVPPVA